MSNEYLQLNLSGHSVSNLYTLCISAKALVSDYSVTVLHNMVTTSDGEYTNGNIIGIATDSVEVYVSKDGKHVLYVNGTWTDGHGHTQDTRFTFYFDESGQVLQHSAEVLETV